MIQFKASREAAEISGALIVNPKRLTKSLYHGCQNHGSLISAGIDALLASACADLEQET